MTFSKFSLRRCSVLALSLAFVGMTGATHSTLAAPKTSNVSATETASSLQIKAGKGAFLKINGEASAVFVADPEVADVEVKFNNMIYIFGGKPGVTTLHILDKDGKILASRNVTVVANVQELQTALNELVPTGGITVYPVNDRMVIKGTVRAANEADMILKVARSFVKDDASIINMINVNESNQITLRVRIAEVKKTVSQQFGINWQSFGRNSGNVQYGLFGKKGLNTTTDTYGIGQNTLNITPDTYTIFGGIGGDKANIDVAIEALQADGSLTLLAEPNLTTVSGETASFLAGGEFPYVVASGSDRNVTQTVEFKQFGVALNFTPVLLSNNRIRLRVNPEVSELADTNVNSNGFAVPSLTTRKVETTVELGDGESFSVAGLFQNSMADQTSQLPWLGELPVLGPLFRSKSFKNNDSELLIIVTPFIVEPVSDPSLLKTPLDSVRVPTDKDRMLYNQSLGTTNTPHNLGSTPAKNLSRNVGFMVN
jgi:pilus assembly protein CpaC